MRPSEKDREELLEDEGLPLEKNDMLAMMLSGLLTVGVPILLILGIIVGVVLLLFT